MKVTSTAPKAPVGPTKFIPLRHIVDFKELGQRDLNQDHVTALTDSIRKNGLDTPLTVWDGGDKYPTMLDGAKEVPSSFLVAGLHRRAALKRLNKEDPEAFAKKFKNGVPCVVKSGSIQDMVCLQLRENIDRLELAPEEILPKILRLRDEFQMKGKQIALAIGKSPSFVSNIFDIETQLGKSGLKEVLEGGIAIRDALKAADEVKKAKKSGESVDADAAVSKAKAKTSSRKEQGREREEKRTSLPKIWSRFKALPTLPDSQAYEILRKGVQYAVGERDALPRELRKDSEKESKTEAK
jgi:ParB/RepB/Spo0J family partition protein